jgi:hypothetical protein
VGFFILFLQSHCRKLYCPSLSLAANGQCIPFLDGGQSYLLILKLVPHEIIFKSDALYSALSYQLPAIQHQLGFIDCELCHGLLYVKQNNGSDRLEEINIQLAVRKTQKCTTESIWLKFTQIERNTTTIMMILDRRKVLFNAIFDYNELLPKFEIKYTFGKHTVIFQCRPVVPERLLYCPKVRLTTREYKEVLDNHSNAKDLLFKQNMDDGKVLVCIQNYVLDIRSAVVKLTVSLYRLILVTILFHQTI